MRSRTCEPEFHAWRKSLLLRACILCAAAIPIGVLLEQPAVWVLGMAGVVVGTIKRGERAGGQRKRVPGGGGLGAVSMTLWTGLAIFVHGKEVFVSPLGEHQFPFGDWAAAATNIQAAVDAAVDGDIVLVADGVYDAGGVVLDGEDRTNRIAVTRSVIVRSVNGPLVTTIMGNGLAGAGGIRCAYLGEGAFLDGFTITGGNAQLYTGAASAKDFYGGGIRCEAGAVVSNCVVSGNAAVRGGGVYGGSVFNSMISSNTATEFGGGSYDSMCRECDIVGNWSSHVGGGVNGGAIDSCLVMANRAVNSGGGILSAHAVDSMIVSNRADSLNGGGVFGGTILGCTIAHNTAGDTGGGGYRGTYSNCVIRANAASSDGGGVADGDLTGCVVDGNSAASNGGGVHDSTLFDCTVIGNVANRAAGAYECELTNSVVASNTSNYESGGLLGGRAENCLIVGNRADVGGRRLYGAAFNAELLNCTIVGNTAGSYGGIFQCSATNCIVYYNTDAAENINAALSECVYTCTIPDPGGVGNITNAPGFLRSASTNLYLLPSSPCIDAGTNLATMAGTTDLDGLPRIINGTVDMGAYEWPHVLVRSVTAPTRTDGTVISWVSFTGAVYAVYGSTDLARGFDVLLQEGLPATPPENSFADPAPGADMRSYRIEYRP